MALKELIQALLAIEETDAPTTKRQAEKIVRDARKALKDNENTVDILRELVDKLDALDQAIDELEDAEPEDREPFHETVIADAGSLRESLEEVSG